MSVPYRESGKPYPEAKLDGLEEMRLEQRKRSRRRMKIVLPPFAVGFIVGPLVLAGKLVISYADGLPFAGMDVIVLGLLAFVSAVAIRVLWKFYRAAGAVLIVGALALTGVWLRANTATRRAARVQSARAWCTDDLRDPEESPAACERRVVHCIARQDVPFGRAQNVLVIGNPCAVADYNDSY